MKQYEIRYVDGQQVKRGSIQEIQEQENESKLATKMHLEKGVSVHQGLNRAIKERLGKTQQDSDEWEQTNGWCEEGRDEKIQGVMDQKEDREGASIPDIKVKWNFSELGKHTPHMTQRKSFKRSVCFPWTFEVKL